MAIAASEIFKNAMKRLSRQTETEVYVEGAATPVQKLSSVKIVSSGFFFGSTMRSIEIKLKGTGVSLLGQRVRVFLKVLNSGEWEQIGLGYFDIKTEAIDMESDTSTFTGYDDMNKLAEEWYASGQITFPTTIANLASQIASHFGLTLATDLSSYPNGSKTISQDPYGDTSNITFRDIVAEIAGATCSMAIINSEGAIEFRALATAAAETLTYDNLFKIKFKEVYGPINSVVLSRTPQEDNIALQDDESVEENGVHELKIANNTLLDNNRQETIQPIFNAVKDFGFYPFSDASTEGHGWHEPGDRLSIDDGNENLREVIITDITLVLGAGVKETLHGFAPEETTTNYALAGGIKKTIYNTEMQVDKNKQQITSIIERQDQFENETARNFSSVVQNIASVITSIQNSGGDNLIKNSAFYALDSDRLPLNWGIAGTGTWSANPSADARANGSLSGQVIALAGETISQIVTAKPDNDDIAEADKTYYSFSCRIKKTSVGSCRVRLSDGTEEGIWDIEVANGETSNYKEFAIEGFLPHSTELTVSVYATNDAEFLITDMMLAVGSYRSKWTQANGEFSNSQVQIDSEGITVKNSNLAGAYVKITPQGLEIYLNSQLIAILSNTAVQAPKAVITDEVDIPPIKMVRQSDGLAFVPTE